MSSTISSLPEKVLFGVIGSQSAACRLTAGKRSGVVRWRHFQMLTPEALRAGLDQFGVRDGDFLLFEAPDLKQDQADFPALLEVLVHAVGKTGTLFVPTCTPREGAPKPPFDPAESVSEAGDFSEFFRRSPGVLRSHHPTHSVAAIGPAAEAGVSAHRAARSRPTPGGTRLSAWGVPGNSFTRPMPSGFWSVPGGPRPCSSITFGRCITRNSSGGRSGRPGRASIPALLAASCSRP